MSEQHYFSETPETEFKPRPVQVELAGRKVTVTTANGIFSPSGIDKGTAILLQEAPEPRGERLLDIGCGWGPITLTLAMLAPQAQVHAVDVNSRSISLTERNAAALGLPNVTVGTPDSVDPELRFDTIWSNPPIRVGKEVLHEILLTWLPRLAPEGTRTWWCRRTSAPTRCRSGWMRSWRSCTPASLRCRATQRRRASVFCWCTATGPKPPG